MNRLCSSESAKFSLVMRTSWVRFPPRAPKSPGQAYFSRPLLLLGGLVGLNLQTVCKRTVEDRIRLRVQEERRDSRRSLFLESRNSVAVDVKCQAHGRVTEPLRNDLGVNTGLQLELVESVACVCL